MRYSLGPTYRRYVKGYDFLSFARKFGDKCGKKLMDTATKVGTSKYGKKVIDTTRKHGSEFAKTAGKRIAQRSNRRFGKLGKFKNKEKETNYYSTRKKTASH